MFFVKYPYPALLEVQSETSMTELSPAFLEKLSTRFPVGSPEEPLLTELLREGFLPGSTWTATNRSVSYEDTNRPWLNFCDEEASVSWSVDSMGRITKLDANHWQTCL
jgi:hypothetical protein